MRTRNRDGGLPEGELLEPLPVLVDGVAVEPVLARRERGDDDDLPSVRELIGAIGSALAEMPVVRSPAWSSYPAPSGGAPARPARSSAAFSRMVALDADRLESLPQWWHLVARNNRVKIAGRLSLAEPHRAGSRTWSTWSMRAWLRGPTRPWPVPVELCLWRHLDGWTRLTVEPRRRVHVGRFYFAGGHRALDTLCDRLARELTRAPDPIAQ